MSLLSGLDDDEKPVRPTIIQIPEGCRRRSSDAWDTFEQYDHYCWYIKKKETEDYCTHCVKRRPLTLRYICSRKIVVNLELTALACKQLPGYILKILMETASKFPYSNDKNTLDIVMSSAKMLLKHLPSEVFDVASMKNGTLEMVNFALDLIEEDLQKLILGKPSSLKLREIVIAGGYIDVKIVYERLLKIVDATKNQCTRINKKYVITTDLYIFIEPEKEELDLAFRLFHQLPEIPFEFRVANACFDASHYTTFTNSFAQYVIDCILKVSPKYLKSFTTTLTTKHGKQIYSPEEISTLGNLLAQSVHLTDLSLIWSKYWGVTEGFVDTVLSLLDQLPMIKKLRLRHFRIITGQSEKLRLPLGLEELHLEGGEVSQVNWEVWGNSPDGGCLRELSLRNVSIGVISPNEGFLKFLTKQAETLKSFTYHQDDSTLDESKEIGRVLSAFTKLKCIEYAFLDSRHLVEFVTDIVPQFSAIRSLESVEVRCDYYEFDDEKYNQLQRSLRKACELWPYDSIVVELIQIPGRRYGNGPTRINTTFSLSL